MIDGAATSVRFQVLSYNVSDRDGGYFADLDVALRRAAARGRAGGDAGQQLVQGALQAALAAEPGGGEEHHREVQATFPRLDAGFIPFGRVEHPKYMIVDGNRGLGGGLPTGSGGIISIPRAT